MSDTPAAFHGLYVDLVAPCDSNGRFLSRELHVHLRRMARVKEIRGVVVNGPAGEASALDHELRTKILQTAVSASPSGFPVFAAVPAGIPDIDREISAGLDAGASGIIVLSGQTREDEARAMVAAKRAAGDASVIAWNISPDVISEAGGVRALIVDSPKEITSTVTSSVMLTDRSFDLDAMANGGAAGAVLASANIAEAVWGRVFRFAIASVTEARTLHSERVGPLQQTLAELAMQTDQQDRTVAAAIKHGLFTITQNTSAATLPPVLDIGEEARQAVSRALTAGRLMPGMS